MNETPNEMCQHHQDEAFQKLSERLSGRELEEAKSFYQGLHFTVVTLMRESGQVISHPIGVENILFIQELVLDSCRLFAQRAKEVYEKEKTL